MALDPGTEIGRGMLVAVLVRLAELMMQLERRGQRRKRHQRQPQQRDEQTYGKAILHGLRELKIALSACDYKNRLNRMACTTSAQVQVGGMSGGNQTSSSHNKHGLGPDGI